MSTLFASASGDRTIIVWDRETFEKLEVLEGHVKAVTTVSWSRYSSSLASGSRDRTVRVWDTDTGISEVLQGHTFDVLQVFFSLDDKRVFSASRDGTIRLWSLKLCTGFRLLELYKKNPGIVALGDDIVLAYAFESDIQFMTLTLENIITTLNRQRGLISPDSVEAHYELNVDEKWEQELFYYEADEDFDEDSLHENESDE